MSQSILYHSFGIKGVTYRSVEYLGNAVIFNAEANNRYVECCHCGHRECIFKGRPRRLYRMPPIGKKQALLRVAIHRLQCRSCEHIWWPNLPFAMGKQRYTRSYAHIVLDILRFATIQAVADFLHVSWNLVKEIHKRKLANTYRQISLANVKYLGVEEFSIHKNPKYMTIFVDLQTGRILHAVEGTSKEVITPSLKRVKKSARRLKAIAMDMSVSYTNAVNEILPQTPVVFDRYHVMALMDRQIDNLRRELQRTLNNEKTKFLKGSRFLLLKNYETVLDDNRAQLDTLLEANAPLYEIHTMKEQLRDIASTVSHHLKGLILYYPHRITNGLLEGLNNKIKTMKRQAYGFRDMDYFKLRLYDLHGPRYAFQ